MKVTYDQDNNRLVIRYNGSEWSIVSQKALNRFHNRLMEFIDEETYQRQSNIAEHAQDQLVIPWKAS